MPAARAAGLCCTDRLNCTLSSHWRCDPRDPQTDARSGLELSNERQTPFIGKVLGNGHHLRSQPSAL
jgi:hypothetical protein